MSWRDTILAQSATRPFTGSLSGVPFMMPTNAVEGGRRTAVHELPQADLPIIDDLGAKAKAFRLTVWVDGSMAVNGDYTDARNALLAVLDAPGPMTLIHPWLGQLSVSQAEPYRLSESYSAGGRATFTLSLIQDSGLTLAPAGKADTPSVTQAAVTAAQSAASTNFGNRWNVKNLPSWALSSLESDLTNTLLGVENEISGITNAVAAQIRAPFNMATAIVGAVNQIAGSFAVPLNAFNLYRSLFNAGNGSPPISTSTPLRLQQLESSWSLHQLVQRAAVAAAANLSSTMTFASSNDALTAASVLLDAIDTLTLATDPSTGLPIDDATYVAFDALRAAVADDLRSRGAQLPELVTYTPAATLPALVLAWQLYGDANRNLDIATRNNLPFPGFVAGGRLLEVLNA